MGCQSALSHWDWVFDNGCKTGNNTQLEWMNEDPVKSVRDNCTDILADEEDEWILGTVIDKEKET